MGKKNNIIILEEDLHNLQFIARDKKFSLRGKTTYKIDIKYIQPNRFHDKIFERNWLFALDILQNGKVFNEVYVLILKRKEDLDTLLPLQRLIVTSNCVDFSDILKDN